MTRERIEEMRKAVLPFVKKKLVEINYEGLGKSDAEEFEKDFNELLNMAIKSLEQEPKTGHWITDAETYYKAINERGNGVNEYTPYFTDDIACSECLAKYSTSDNETEFFIYCPNCGSKNE